MTNKKILMIVDDDGDDRFFFVEAVKQINASYECREAHDGIEALEQLHRAKTLPHFIFLDLNLPLMAGWEFLKELRNESKLRNIPVIIYTTSSTAMIGSQTTNTVRAVSLLSQPKFPNFPERLLKQ